MYFIIRMRKLALREKDKKLIKTNDKIFQKTGNKRMARREIQWKFFMSIYTA